jgi:hypothetical protein
MALEDLTGIKYLNALESANPTVADPRSQGDDHLRGIKNVLKLSFPNVNGAVNPTPTEFNRLVGLTSAIEEQGNKTAAGGYATLASAAEVEGKALNTRVVTPLGLANFPHWATIGIYDESDFTFDPAEFSVDPQFDMEAYVDDNDVCHIVIASAVLGTSAGATWTMSSIPAAITPATLVRSSVGIGLSFNVSNVPTPVFLEVGSGGVMKVFPIDITGPSSWAGLSKGFANGTVFSYKLS